MIQARITDDEEDKIKACRRSPPTGLQGAFAARANSVMVSVSKGQTQTNMTRIEGSRAEEMRAIRGRKRGGRQISIHTPHFRRAGYHNVVK
ncbi:hypothetical protein NQZ68_017071 [Dissostichus eleginoides]|nr:hypothetical protein NQZ68_017071 [Dissostichus eleginoides]